jgi:transcriptional regulator with GAF, ATPase, and Fis domain/tetratricopeptide (TPR) repeat protein
MARASDSPNAAAADLPPGLELVSVLSSSKSGEVLKVRRAGQDLVLRIALKGTALEAALASRVKSPGLVAPVAWGDTPGGRPYVLRPFVEGRSFGEAMADAGPDQLQSWVVSLLETLGLLHDAGLVHRDIKAQNVVVGADGPVLIDLDLLVSVEGGAPSAGSAWHIAPEVLLGQTITPAADLFSLGVMLALGSCGPAADDFHTRFPTCSFWEASGLDATTLTGELGALVRSLVRRHPADRPASAQEAARHLTGSAGALPALGLPFVAGRDDTIIRLVSGLASAAGARFVELITVADEEERSALIDALQLGLTVEGQRAVRREIVDPAAAAIDAIAEDPSDCVLIDGTAAATDHGGGSLAELVAAFVGAPDRNSGALVLVLEAGLAQDVVETLRTRGLEEEAGQLRMESWPRVPVGALARHLQHLTGESSPDVAVSLANSLHRLTRGRRADLNRALSRAVEVGVLRPDPPRYAVLRSDWPDDEVPGSGRPELSLLGVHARELLAALAVIQWIPTRQDLEALLAGEKSNDPEALSAALAELDRAGVIQHRAWPGSQVDVVDSRWTVAARQELDAAESHSLRVRALDRLNEINGPLEARAAQTLALAESSDDLPAVLNMAEELLKRGRLAATRHLLEDMRSVAQGDIDQRRCLLEARLELAQGDSRNSLAVLTEKWGEELAGAAPTVLLMAAHAAEQAGRRSLASDLNERVLAAEPDRDEWLRATLGVAYSVYLDGDAEAALAHTQIEWEPTDSDTAVGGLLNLRGVVLTRLGRGAEAVGAFDLARARAEHAGDPLLLARTEVSRAHLDRRNGRLTEARESLHRALDAFTAAGHVQGRAMVLNNLGVLQRNLGELAAARDLLGQAQALCRRVGDTLGAASSQGSLAAAELEAGHVGMALEALDRARTVFTAGDYERELAFLDVHQAMALSLAGRHGEAAEVLSLPSLHGLRDEQPGLVERAEAVLHLVGDQRESAAQLARAAMERARDVQDDPELFRAAAMLVAAEPDDADGRSALGEAAARLDSPVRRDEAAWLCARGESFVDAEQLTSWCRRFSAAGRTDLVAAVSRQLAVLCDGTGDRSGRRSASARVTQAADALTDGLPIGERTAILRRLAQFSGPRPVRHQRSAGLSVDWLLSCNRRMATEDDLEALLLSIVDMALEITGSRRGFLVLLDGESFDVQVARNMGQLVVASDEARFSRTVVLQAVRDDAPVMTTDAAADSRFTNAASINTFQLRSVLCVPLSGIDDGGALYLDDNQQQAAFDETDVERVRALADQASVAIARQRRQLEIVLLNGRLEQRVAFTESELAQARKALRRRGDVSPVGGMVGSSEVMRDVYSLIDRVAPTDLAVLVTGPTGTGKDLATRALHERSHRSSGPLVIENVAAVPANLLESEMFGHVRGAFTGADRDRHGLFAEADGGTFVLDEIGELPLELQPKLLRVLEDGVFRPVGSRRSVKVDVRIVAATNRNLFECVQDGSFREDLYYRLNAVEIRLPPLAERVEDVPLLVRHFLDRLAEKHGSTKRINDVVISALVRRPWPGHVRELSNEVSRLYFLSDAVIENPQLVRVAQEGAQHGASADSMPASLTLEDVERVAIERALRAADNKKEKAARLLGISRAGLYAKLRRLEEKRGGGEDDVEG